LDERTALAALLTWMCQAMKLAASSAAFLRLATCSPTASPSLIARCLFWNATSRSSRTWQYQRQQ
jgi:hypothetical protein